MTWQPRLSPKQAEIVNDRHRYLLVTGPKKTGKTIGCCVKVADHMYRYGRANVAIIAHRTHTAKSGGGVWNDLTKLVIEDQYQAEGGVLPYTREPGIEPDSKKNIFRVRSHCGEESQCSLISIHRIKELERILKSSRYSMIYITEADLFPDRRVLKYCSDQLRCEMVGIPREGHHILLDCNPPETGEEHWLHGEFFTEDGDRDLAEYNVIQVKLDDNPFMSEAERRDLINNYINSPSDYARYVMGEWVASQEGSCFERIFRETEHIVGVANDADEPRVLVPDPAASALIVGLDMGSVRNHAAVIFAPRQIGVADFAFDIVDEVVSVGPAIRLESLAEMVTRKVKWWLDFHEKRNGRRLPVRCWSDATSETYIAAADKTERHIFQQVSEGLLNLVPVMKGAGSVDDRLKNISLLLNSNRIMVASRCKDVVKCLLTLKQPLKKNQQRHVFDALSYGICNELPAAWGRAARPASTASRSDVIQFRL